MPIPPSYGLGLPGLSLKDLWGLIEKLEGFVSGVYNDGANNPTIGYGFNLTENGSGGSPDTHSLGAVLDQLQYSVTVAGANYSGNVFQVAAALAAANGQATSWRRGLPTPILDSWLSLEPLKSSSVRKGGPAMIRPRLKVVISTYRAIRPKDLRCSS
jgi:hypothetical protein